MTVLPWILLFAVVIWHFLSLRSERASLMFSHQKRRQLEDYIKCLLLSDEIRAGCAQG